MRLAIIIAIGTLALTVLGATWRAGVRLGRLEERVAELTRTVRDWTRPPRRR